MQRLLTERLFRTLFDNPDYTYRPARRKAIAERYALSSVHFAPRRPDRPEQGLDKVRRSE